jgi:Alkylmercury lyase
MTPDLRGGSAMTTVERAIRLYVYEHTVAQGHPPAVDALAAHFDLDRDAMVRCLRRLEAARALLVSRDGGRIEAVPPFSATPTPHWVETPRGGWWGHTAWQALAVPVVLKSDATIYSRSGGYRESIELTLRGEILVARPEVIVHVSVPAALWWDDIRYTCASILFFRNEAEVHRWCERSGFPRGSTMSLEQCWQLAVDWYEGRLRPDWRRLSIEEAQASLHRVGLVGPFWELSPAGARAAQQTPSGIPDASGYSE